jgi:hypothetical protein
MVISRKPAPREDTMAATQITEETVAAREALRTAFPRDSYVTTLLRHRSDSGSTKWVSVLAADEQRWISDVSGIVARAIGRQYDSRRGAIKLNGCDTDAELQIVMELGLALYGDTEALLPYRV